MKNRFISWLYFPYFQDIQNHEIKILKEVIYEININSKYNFSLKYEEYSLGLSQFNNESLSYSYLLDENTYHHLIENENSNFIIIHYPDKYIYTKFIFALKNIVRFIPENLNINFEEIKGLNIFDLILVPSIKIKDLLIKKHIKSEKIIVLPFLENLVTDNKLNYKFETCSTIEFKKIINRIIQNTFNSYINYLNISNSTNIYDEKINSVIRQISEENKEYNHYIFDITDKTNKKIILNKVSQLSSKYQYILITSYSEIYSENYSKKAIEKLLSDFNIIQSLYYGDKKLNYFEKEKFLIIIKNNPDKFNKKYLIWEGSQLFYNSLAVINREIELEIIKDNNYQLSIIPQDYYEEITDNNWNNYYLLKNHFNRLLLKKNDFYIRHVLPSGYKSPDNGYYILIFPWEYGKIPDNLIKHINSEVDQVWCPSNYVKQLHISNGVLKNKLVVIPNGINPEIFNPNIKPLKLNTKKEFKFLFLGGIIHRKGIDILLDAYIEEFKNNESVSLVIKGLGYESYYQENSIQEKIINFASDNNNPEIYFFEDNLDIEEMGKIYTSCNCYVHPYRAEGFGMPIAEAMACGLPAIVPSFGPALDFCSNDNCYFLDFKLKETDNFQSSEKAIICEVDKESLKKQMRKAFTDRTELKVKGFRARNIVEELSWNKIFEKIKLEFENLKKQPVFRKNKPVFIDKMKQEITDNNNNQSIDKLLLALESISDTNEIKEFIADVYYKNNDYKNSLKYFSEIIKTNPSKDNLNKMADLLEQLGDKKTANSLRNIRNKS